MSRYRKVRALWDEEKYWQVDEPLLPHLEVPEHIGRFTGLYDADGDPIYVDPRPIGFGRDEEW